MPSAISALPLATTVNNTDLVPVDQTNSDGTITTRAVSAALLTSTALGNTQLASVVATATDASASAANAVAAVTTLTNSALTLTTPITPTLGTRGRTLASLVSPVFRPENYGAIGDGVTDDSAALQATFNAFQAAPYGGTIDLQGRYLVSTPLTLVVGSSINPAQSLILKSGGTHGARVISSSGFNGGTNGTVIDITLSQISGSNGYASANQIYVEGITFVANHSGLNHTALHIHPGATASGAGNINCAPSVDVSSVTVMAQGASCFAYGVFMDSVNVTRVRNMVCFAMKTGAVGLYYDLDGVRATIAVQHWIDNFYYNGAGTGCQIGHYNSAGTGPNRGNLQGFTFTKPSFTGCDVGILCQTNNGFDQLIIDGGQFNTNTNTASCGISLLNAATVKVSNSYFLGCPTGVYSSGGSFRMSITDNTFSGVDAAGQTAIRLTTEFDLAQGGCLIEGNIFDWYIPETGQYGNGSPIILDGSTDGVCVIGNQFVTGTGSTSQIIAGVKIVADQSTGTHNLVFGNVVNQRRTDDTPTALRGQVIVSTATALTAIDVDTFVVAAGASTPFTITLPANSTVPVGARIYLNNQLGAGALLTIAPASSDVGPGSFVMHTYDSVELMATGNGWATIAFSNGVSPVYPGLSVTGTTTLSTLNATGQSTLGAVLASIVQISTNSTSSTFEMLTHGTASGPNPEVQFLATGGTLGTPNSGNLYIAAAAVTLSNVLNVVSGVQLSSDGRAVVRWDQTAGKYKFSYGGTDVFSVDTVGNAKFAGTVTPSVTP